MEKVGKLLTGVEKYDDFLKRSEDFQLGTCEPENFKDLIKDYVQCHTSEDEINNLLEGFEKYDIKTNKGWKDLSQIFKLTLSFSFFRTGMDDDSDGTTVSLNI